MPGRLGLVTPALLTWTSRGVTGDARYAEISEMGSSKGPAANAGLSWPVARRGGAVFLGLGLGCLTAGGLARFECQQALATSSPLQWRGKSGSRPQSSK
jgi:hypothetical protein